MTVVFPSYAQSMLTAPIIVLIVLLVVTAKQSRRNAAMTAKKQCRQCGARYGPEAQFCGQCGRAFDRAL